MIDDSPKKEEDMSTAPVTFSLIADDVKLGHNVRLYGFVNLYGCEIGDETRVGTFVEIQHGARIGRRCKISSHTFICEGVAIEDDVFIGHGVMFINDRYPRAVAPGGQPQTTDDWECAPTWVRRGASLGSGVTVLGGITIGEDAMVGAGSVVTRDVPPGVVVVGNPARFLRLAADAPAEAHEPLLFTSALSARAHRGAGPLNASRKKVPLCKSPF